VKSVAAFVRAIIEQEGRTLVAERSERDATAYMAAVAALSLSSAGRRPDNRVLCVQGVGMIWRVGSQKKDLWAAALGSCKRWLGSLLFVVLAVLWFWPLGDDPIPTASPTRKPTATPPPLADGYGGLPVRVVDRSWTVEALLARSELEQSAVWADGEELTFFYQGEAEAVDTCCGIQLPMRRVGDSDAWALTVRVEGLAQAVISYFFIPYQDGHPVQDMEGMGDLPVWRGPDAPAALERAEALQGQIDRYAIDSMALDESRDLTVYLPPGHDPTQQYPVVYAADGASVDGFAAILDPLIVEGNFPAVIVVGVHAGAYTGPAAVYDRGQDLRVQEYLWGENQARFEAHERFFVYEVSDWAEQTVGASSNREARAVFGFSNGGAFAVSMGIRHPEHYGAVLAFSLGMGPDGWGTPQWTADIAPRHYLVAGTLEPFQEPTARWAAKLARMGVEHVHRERVCGHDPVLWEEEFPGAVVWAFGDR